MRLMCPRCRTRKLGELEIAEILIDRCLCCGGLWFDSDEIYGLIGRTPAVRRVETTVPPEGDVVKELACPRCADVPLRALPLAGEGEAARIVYRCASCSGTWLDRGELREFEDKHLGEALKSYFMR
jgi:Zn-finger nucleic acid-binding protein